MATVDSQLPLDNLLNAGAEALAAGDWDASRAYFQAAVDVQPTSEALEGLAMAAWWLDDATLVFDSRQRAYHSYRQRGDRLGAARTATWIGLDHYIYRGDLAIANGWLRRAHRLLDGTEPAAEHGWLALWEAHIALFEYNDIATAKRNCAETFTLAQALGSTDLEMLVLALEGLALVSEGHIDEGMRRLDESTTAALAGEMTDPDAIVTTCCYLIFACERTRDFDRAAQWCEKAEEVSRRWSYRSMFGICRTHYAAVLIWRGEWSRAEAELSAATRELIATRPGWAGESILRLAELRRRQGRLEEAGALFEQMSAHPLALLGQAELALDRGDAVAAADLIDRFFRRVPSDDRTTRITGLELAVRIQVALELIDQAQASLAELESTASLVGTEPVRATVSFVRGIIAASASELDEARRCFEDAIDLFEHAGAPFEAAIAHVELARTLSALGRQPSAMTEAQVALELFRQLGAERKASQAARLLRELAAALPDTVDMASSPTGLTRRETEVLRLVARGYSNQQIGDRLFISIRTVERHISTIYEKIGAEGSAARAIATAYAIDHGLVQPLGS